MKKLLSLVLVSFVAVSALAGCGSKTGSNGKKVLSLLETSNIPSMRVWEATDTVSFTMMGQVFEGLVSLGENGKIENGVAESWTVSEDGKTYTFKLRDNAKWVDVNGKEYANVTANDFVYTWKKLGDPNSASQYNFMLTTAGIKGAAAVVNPASIIISYDQASNDLKTIKESDFKDDETTTAKEQFAAAKADLEATVADALAQLTALGYKDVEDARKNVVSKLDELGVKALDERTLEVTLDVPTPYFLALMAFPSFYPQNEKFATEKGDKFGSSVDTLLYNGAYIFKEWKLSESHVIAKNPKYWDAKNVKVDEVNYRVVEDIANDTAVNMYIDGQIQRVGLSGANVTKYGTRPDVQTRKDTVLFYLELNQGKGKLTPNRKLLGNVNARKAINMAINKKYITDEIFKNGSQPADYFVPSGFVSGPAGTKYEGVDFRKTEGVSETGYNAYNKDEAKKLMETARKETGVTESITLELIIFQGDTGAAVGAHIKNELETTFPKVKVNLLALTFAEKLARVDKGEYDLNWGGWGPDYPDPMTFMDMWVTGGGHNNLGYSNPAYDKLVNDSKEGALVTDLAARWEALTKAEKILLEEDQAIVPLYQRASVQLADPAIKNWYSQTFGPDYFLKWVDLESK